jgi:glycosyltransferase involved in cell wall biosynthesis
MAYDKEFKIEKNEINNKLKIITIKFPYSWPRLIKAIILTSFNFIQTCKNAQHSSLLLYSGGSIFLTIPGILASKIFRRPLIYDYVDIEVECKFKTLNILLMRQISVIFAISHFLVQNAKNYGCKYVEYFPSIVDTEMFKINIENRIKMRNELTLENEIIIGYAGALAYTEGMPILIRAFHQLLKKHQNINLCILGTKQLPMQGDETLSLIQELGIVDKIKFFPPVKHDEVPVFLSMCDILCSPKIDCEINRAANPIKVVEYLSMGIPTVCSKIGETERLIVNGQTGFLISPGDIDYLTETFEWIILHPYEAKIIADAGRQFVQQRYSHVAVIDTVKRIVN